MTRTLSLMVAAAAVLVLLAPVRAQAPAPAPDAAALAVNLATAAAAGYTVTAKITTPGGLIDGKAATFYGNVSGSEVKAACALIAAGATTVNVSVTPDAGAPFTETLALDNPSGGAAAATTTGDTSAMQVTQTCANQSPSAQGIEFLFKDQNANEIAVLCDAENATPEQLAGTPFGKDTSTCRVYLLGTVPAAILASSQVAGLPTGAIAPAPQGTELASLTASAVGLPQSGTAAGAKRHLLLSRDDCDNICSFTLFGCVCEAFQPSSGSRKAEGAQHNCFPAHAEVTVLRAGGSVRATPMSELRTGDKIASLDAFGRPSYEEIYFFGHRDNSAFASMLSITAGNATLTLTERHFVPVGGPARSVMKYARDVILGDILTVVDERGTPTPAIVTAIAKTLETGLYNPYTKNGALLVNGVLASAHSETMLDDLTPASLTHRLPGLYQVAFKPVYWVYKVVGADAMHSFKPENWHFNGADTLVGASALMAFTVAAFMTAHVKGSV